MESGCRGCHPGLTSFRWAILGSDGFVMSILGFPSKESTVIGVGEARKRLVSSRVSMENDKPAKKTEERGACGGHMVWAAVT